MESGPPDLFTFTEDGEDYLAFLGRISPGIRKIGAHKSDGGLGSFAHPVCFFRADYTALGAKCLIYALSLTMSALSKPFLAHFSIPLRRVSSFIVFFGPTIDDHGSPVIYRPASVRPKHLSDQSFDHDYFFKLPWQGAGCPIKCTAF